MRNHQDGEKLTDEDIRIGYLVTCGWPITMAEKYVRDNPKQKMVGESFAILGQRWEELKEAIKKSFKRNK